MSNSGRFAPRDLPLYFLHPMHNHQPSAEEFEASSARVVEAREGLCPGHKGTVIHLAGSGEDRRFIVEVKLAGGSCYIESPCTYTPAMGMDALDGHLAYDAEEWLLVQQLRVKPRRLRVVFGNNDRLIANDYIKSVSNIRVSEDAEYEFEERPTPTLNNKTNEKAEQYSTLEKPKKKWWKFW